MSKVDFSVVEVSTMTNRPRRPGLRLLLQFRPLHQGTTQAAENRNFESVEAFRDLIFDSPQASEVNFQWLRHLGAVNLGRRHGVTDLGWADFNHTISKDKFLPENNY